MSQRPKEPVSEILSLSAYGRACLHFLNNEITRVKPQNEAEATRFLWWNCGFSDSSIERVKVFLGGVETNCQLLESMKAMSVEELFLLIHSLREPSVECQERRHFTQLPFGLLKEILQSTLFVVNTKSTVLMSMFAGDASDALNRNRLTEMLSDRFTCALKIFAHTNYCSDDAVMLVSVPSLGVSGSERSLDISLQAAIHCLTEEEGKRYVGILLAVDETNDPEYGQRLDSLHLPYKAIQNRYYSPIVIRPGSYVSSMAKIKDPSCMDRIAGKNVKQVTIVDVDWMKAFDRVRENEPILHNINDSVSDEMMLSLKTEWKKAHHRLMQDLIIEAVEAGPFSKSIVARLEDRYPGLRAILLGSQHKIKELGELKQVEEKKIQDLLGDAWLNISELDDMLHAAEAALEKWDAQVHQLGLGVVDIVADRKAKLQEDICLAREEKAFCMQMHDEQEAKEPAGRQEINVKVPKLKESIQTGCLQQCFSHIEKIEPRNLNDLIRRAITPGPLRVSMRTQLDRRYPGLGEKSDEFHEVIRRLDTAEERVNKGICDGEEGEPENVRMARLAMDEAFDVLEQKNKAVNEFKAHKPKNAERDKELELLQKELTSADAAQGVAARNYAEVLNKSLNAIGPDTESTKALTFKMWADICYPHIAKIEEANISGGAKPHLLHASKPRRASEGGGEPATSAPPPLPVKPKTPQRAQSQQFGKLCVAARARDGEKAPVMDPELSDVLDMM